MPRDPIGIFPIRQGLGDYLQVTGWESILGYTNIVYNLAELVNKIALLSKGAVRIVIVEYNLADFMKETVSF